MKPALIALLGVLACAEQYPMTMMPPAPPPPPPAPPPSAAAALASVPRFEPAPGPATDRCSDRLITGRGLREMFLAGPLTNDSEHLFRQNEEEMRTAWQACQDIVDRDAALAAQSKAFVEREAKKRAEREDAAARKDAEERAQKESDEASWKSDPAWMVPLLSRRLCISQETRAEAFEEIRKQKKYSKIGGVLDLSAISASQDTIREENERSAELKSAIASYGTRPLACRHPDVTSLRECLGTNEAVLPERCKSERARKFQRLDARL